MQNDDKLQQVIVIRKDLTMRKGKMIAQGGHAVAIILINHFNDEQVKHWFSTGQTKICVYVESEEELLRVYNDAQTKNLICCLIEDSGLTEFNGVSTLTCCAIGPASKSQLQPITGHLKLL
jgi:PTH2 family peptidyl-tRNA hydrolase